MLFRSSILILDIIVCSSLLVNTSKALNFENNGYKNLVVSISPDVEEGTDGESIIENIKEWISSGSKNLYRATKRNAYIDSVDILIPANWNYKDAVESEDYAFTDGSIRLDLPNAVHLDTPYTLQPGGCGDNGEYIHVTRNYILELNGTSTENFGPPGKVFVHEWAKFRYGVFEEYGYPGDDRYPMFYYDRDGQLVPNYCTDSILDGYSRDISDGGSCKNNPMTGMPDSNCLFFISTTNNDDVTSSYMAVPFLPNVNDFCEIATGEIHKHDWYGPTRQNVMCYGQSTWEVIRQSEDFSGLIPLDDTEPPPTSFNIFQPGSSTRYVLILDKSTSMNEPKKCPRIDRLKEASKKFVLYDVPDGDQVGVVEFCEKATEATLVTIDDNSRQTIAKQIDDINTCHTTCLACGLEEGLNALDRKGGILIFITDGEDTSKDPNHEWPNSELEERIKKENVRVITLAIGSKSDDDLEHLAEISNGISYFDSDDDCGIVGIDSVFRGAMSFQPAVPSKDLKMLIFSESFSFNDVKSIEGSFNIDQTLGRDVSFEVSYKIPDYADASLYFHVTYPNGTFIPISALHDKTNTFTHIFSSLEVGHYSFDIKYESAEAPKEDSYIFVQITSKCRDELTLPIQTKCWVSSGSSDFDAADTETRLAVLASVTQGSNPVLDAKVEAIVNEGPEQIVMSLYDTGSGADLVGNDGIYSKYFTQFNQKGRYSLSCRIKGDNETKLVVSKDLESPPIDPGSSKTPVCCGSSTNNGNYDTSETGIFERNAPGGSFKVINDNGNTKIPPGRIIDLTASAVDSMQPSLGVSITFTAPGDDLDEGKAAFYDVRYMRESDANSTDTEKLFQNATQISEGDVLNGNLTLNVTKEAYDTFEIILKQDIFGFEKFLFMAKAIDNDEISAIQVSNIFRFSYPQPPEDDYFTGGQIFGIILGCFLLGALIGCLIFGVLIYTGVVEKPNIKTPNVKMPKSFNIKKK